MKNDDVIKGLKDEKFREGLSNDDRASLPDNPAGSVELTDNELDAVAGGTTGSDPSICACEVTKTGTGAGCSCVCPDEEAA